MHLCHCKDSMIEESLGDTMFYTLEYLLFLISRLFIVWIHLKYSMYQLVISCR